MHPIYAIVCSLFLIANFVPGHLTLTVNKGETVHLSMLLLGSEKRDVTWKYNGRFSEDRGKYLFNRVSRLFSRVCQQNHFCFHMFGAGNYFYMTHWNEMVNGTAVLAVENATIANQGIYSASYMGDSPLNGAWMRLIVRGLLEADIGT